MDGGIRERVEALRQEIGEIQKLNLAYLQTPRPDFTAMDAHADAEAKAEGNYEGIEIHDCVERTLEDGG